MKSALGVVGFYSLYTVLNVYTKGRCFTLAVGKLMLLTLGPLIYKSVFGFG